MTDPDSGTTNRLYFDDRLIEVVEYSIDPGAGFTRADWDEAREYALSVTSGRLQADLAETYEAASDSPHIAPPTGHS